jgi:ankyrin repeat protein
MYETNNRTSILILRDDNGETALHRAALCGYPAVIESLLEAGASVKLRTLMDGATALHCAASKGHVQCVEILLRHKAFVKTFDKQGNTPLHLAAWHGHDEVVQMLLDAGANLSAKNNERKEAIEYARNWKHESTVKLLLRAAKEGPLHRAALEGNAELVERLLGGGEDVSMGSDSSGTPLHRAAYGGHNQVVQILLRNGADPDAKTHNGATALQIAISCGHADVVETLLGAGTDITAKFNGWAPLQSAAQYGNLRITNLVLGASTTFLHEVHLQHISSIHHRTDCSHGFLKLLKCLVAIYPEDPLIQRAVANEYFRQKMFPEAEESFDVYMSVAMRNSGVSEVADVHHVGYLCDECGTELHGKFHKCTQCDWFYDACNSCFARHSDSCQHRDPIQIPSATFNLNR